MSLDRPFGRIYTECYRLSRSFDILGVRLPKHSKASKIPPLRRREDRANHIYRVAAQIMCRKGYEATSMNDIGAAVGLTKPGLYHYLRGKEDLLFRIMSYGMDVVDDLVIAPAKPIADAEQRLRTMIEGHVGRIMEEGGEVTIILEEMWALKPAHREIIRLRKRAYFDLIRRTLLQLSAEGKLHKVNPTVAAFSLLGMINWISRWYVRGGKLKPSDVATNVLAVALHGLLQARRTSKKRN
jgi:AcrR family transcriptional regulator